LLRAKMYVLVVGGGKVLVVKSAGYTWRHQ